MGTFIVQVAGAGFGFLRVYQMALILRVYLAWFPNMNLYSQPFYTLLLVTNPYLRLWRGLIPAVGPFDLSPVVGFLAIGFAEDVFATLGHIA
jgi:YggT family protein